MALITVRTVGNPKVRLDRRAYRAFLDDPAGGVRLDLHARGLVEPAAVVGVPVGFVGAAESKQALWDGPLAPLAIPCLGERGGTPVAAGALTALWRLKESTC